MAITWYSSQGQPSDNTGVAGDLCWDTQNRITWGPKTTTWAQTSYSNIGPTGQALLSGTGAPSAGLGQQGSGYFDTASGNTWLKSSSGWSQTGTILGPTGATGAQGFTSLTQFAMGIGPVAAASSVTLSSTAQALTIPGSTVPSYFTPTSASALLGANFYQGGSACTIALYNVTTSTVVYSFSLSTSTQNVGSFTTAQYPLTANNTYQWQISGSGTATLQVNPMYLLPAGQLTAGSCLLQGFTSASGTSLSSTVQYIGPGPKTSSSNSYTRGYTPIRTGAALSFTGLYVPSAAGAASATATFTLYSYALSGGAIATVTTFTATNNSTPQITTPSAPLPLTSAYIYFIGVTGSGTGQVDAQINVQV